MSNTAAIITSSSGKSAELKQFAGVFSCLLEHEVTKTKATFNYTGPKISQAVWAQVMEFFEWTYGRDKSESQVRLFVHPEHGWKAWAFPQEGGTFMTSKELPMDTPEATQQRAQFDAAQGWLYWGTVHHHCSAGAFASGTDEANEKDQEGLHITIGHMDKAVRDFHCRMYIKGHKFDPMMHHFWELDPALLAKADEMKALFGMSADLNTLARKSMCQNSTALYGGLNPPWVLQEGMVYFPPEWMDNYRVRAAINSHIYIGPTGGMTTAQRLGGDTWCHKCYDWGYHSTDKCPFPNQKKDKRRTKYKNQKLLPLASGEGKTSKAATLLDDLEAQAAVMGVPTENFYRLIDGLADGNNGALLECIVESMLKEKITADDMLLVILEREVKDELTEKNAPSGVQEQQQQINGGIQSHEWDGYGH